MTLFGAIITYFVLIFLERLNFSIIVELLFGTQEDNFVNLHSLILIIAMMMIVIISNEAGVFQFIAILLIKFSKGKPITLMSILCALTVLISAILNNILTVIILIPLTITISRMINMDPTPYILTQAVLVNIGGTIFSISSIPNILITTYANIFFLDFFINVGLISLVIFGFTLIFFVFLYKKELFNPKEGARVLEEFNIWNLVQNRKLLYMSCIALITVFIFFIIIPPSILPPDMIALTVALILVIISGLEPKEIIKNIDFELILYLLGIFIITGGLEITGVTMVLGDLLFAVGSGEPLTQIIIILWVSAILSSNIDNIPITKVLIPIIAEGELGDIKYYSLAIGANWGDNLTPLGDNILVMNIAEQNKRPITFKQFFKLGFTTTVYQLLLTTIIFISMHDLILGLLIVIIIILSIGGIFITYKKGPKVLSLKINKYVDKFRNKIIK